MHIRPTMNVRIPVQVKTALEGSENRSNGDATSNIVACSSHSVGVVRHTMTLSPCYYRGSKTLGVERNQSTGNPYYFRSGRFHLEPSSVADSPVSIVCCIINTGSSCGSSSTPFEPLLVVHRH
jgi:hypothetical protein